jgi:WD40 repeat protein
MEFEAVLEVADESVFLKAGRRLAPVEVAILRGSWQRKTYDQVADEAGYSANYLKLDVGPKLWKLLSDTFGEPVSKTTLQAVLERQWRKQQTSGVAQQSVPETGQSEAQPRPDSLSAFRSSASAPELDWGEAPDTSVFYGRTLELDTLTHWIQRDRSRLVALLGMGGMGKSSLAAKIARQLRDEFQYVIWRSLRNAPLLETVLADLVPFLSGQQDAQAKPDRLLHWLRQHRCLVILDNVETILLAGDRAGQYQPGYQNYGELLRSLGESSHQSCVILTSREKPAEIGFMEDPEASVTAQRACASLLLEGSQEIALALLEAKGLSGTDREKRQLGEYYSWSPLALKIVAASIHSLFDGAIAPFLAEETRVFNGLRRLLQQQFERLSPLEMTIMGWLAINREWTTIAELSADITPSITKARLLECLESLAWRSLLEKRAGSYTQQPVVMEYVTTELIDRMVQAVLTANLSDLGQFALLKTTSKDYIRDSQICLLLQPIARQVQQSLATPEALTLRLQALLEALRHSDNAGLDYAAGNLFNLCCQLNLPLSTFDFSGLQICQADLQGRPVQRVNFSNAQFVQCAFTQTFGAILAVAFHPHQPLIALGDINGAVRLWQLAVRQTHGAETEQPLLTLRGHTSWVLSVAWSPDGQRLASCCDYRTIKLWDAQTGQCLATLRGHLKPVWSVTWSPDGRQLATSSSDRTIRVWDATTGDCLQILEGHQNLVWSVAWSPDGTTLASGSDDQTIRLWDVCSGQCRRTWPIPGYWVRCVAWSPDGQILATASSDLIIRLWDISMAQPLKCLSGHRSWIYSLAWSPDGSNVASGSGDRTIKLWDVTSGDCLKTLQGHQEPVWSVSWNADGTLLASGSHDQTVRLWIPQTGQCRRTLQGYSNWIRSVVWSPDGTALASSSTDKTVKLWDVASGHCLNILTGHQGWVFSVAWSPTDPVVASSGTDATVKLWNTRTGQCLQTLQGHASWVWSVAWRPDGRRLATGSSTNDLTVRIWDPETGECLQIFSGHQSWIWWVRWSPDGQTLATVGNDQQIKLWDPQTGTCLRTWQDANLLGLALAWSPDGRYLATSSPAHSIQILEVQTGKADRALVGHQGLIWAIAYSTDGNFLASGSDDGTIRIWDMQTERCVHVLRGHQNRIWSVAWSPLGANLPLGNGQTLVSSSSDETIRLWDAQTGMCLNILRTERPYEGMNISGIRGVTEAQQTALKALGAVEQCD